ncbi:LamG-like jellyroll fold domain-containing protein [Halobium salinum]|uniref:LamG-like jellyroll fold domain-containing protein n=1 Tax=Halobium salinum TaxID=1364940 RepID=A0ABD5P9Q3_9EURY|nr:LamG-like jellyroll fold domain-containing protein [Halobium salinum]
MFRGDERAVSETVGAVLLFGFLIVSMSMYQATIVPAANEEVEFKHSQSVQADLVRLHGTVGEVAATDALRSVSVSLGTQYPQRTFFVNPPDPAGRLSTTDDRFVGLINAEADGETGDFWRAANYHDVYDAVQNHDPGFAREQEGWWIHSHRAVEYHPNYHADTGDWRVVLDPPGFYSEYDGTPVKRSSRSPIDGRRIRLVLVNGSLSTAHSGTENVDVEPVSADTRTVTVENGGSDPILLHYPTELPKSEWATIIEPERTGNGGHVANWDYYTYEGQDYVYLVLEKGVEYDLSLAKVGVGSEVSDEPPQYAVDVAGDGAAVPEDGTQRVTVEVRDAYNGPKSGVPVTVTDPATLGTVSAPGGDDGVVRTDEDGRATFVYEPDGPVHSTQTDEFALGFDGPDAGGDRGSNAAERVDFEVELRDTDDSSPPVAGLRWESAADWNAGDGRSVVHEELPGTDWTDAGTLRLGYTAEDSSLVSYWALDEPSGSTVRDAVGSNDGTNAGGSIGAAGAHGSNGYRFAGTGERVDVDTNMDVAGSGLTLSAWVKADSWNTNGDQRIISKATGEQDPDHYWMLSEAQTKNPRFRLKTGGSTTKLVASSTVPAGEWVHMVATYDGGHMRIYVDGTQVAVKQKTGTVSTNSEVPVALAANPSGAQSLDGNLDEVRVYDRGLSASEVEDMHLAGSTGEFRTDWKTTDGTHDVGSLRLEDVEASIPPGTSATVYVESDTDGDGVVEETSDPVELDGSGGPYVVSGLTADSGTFRLRVELDTTSPSKSPTFSGATVDDA